MGFVAAVVLVEELVVGAKVLEEAMEVAKEQ